MGIFGMRMWLFPLALMIGSAQAGQSDDLCQLMKDRKAANGFLATFVIHGDYQHGLAAASASCPKLRTEVNIRTLGQGKKARSFYGWIFAAPKLSGMTEVQATINFSGSEISLIRLHAYRELPELLAKPFFHELSPAEQAAAERAARSAAEAADAASRR